jgi:hypothetical protein
MLGGVRRSGKMGYAVILEVGAKFDELTSIVRVECFYFGIELFFY